MKILVCQHKGWINSVRKHKHNTFVDLNDGSSIHSLQLVIEPAMFESAMQYGSSVVATGSIIETSKNTNRFEMVCDAISLLGECDPQAFPIKHNFDHSMQHLRSNLHLRMRQFRMAGVLRIRNQLETVIHKYFQEKGFLHVHTPIMTSSDCEGAGEVFSIISDYSPDISETDLNHVDQSNDANSGLFGCARTVDLSKNVFRAPTYLTVSAQLHLEACAMGMGDVYTLSPTFRAEKSNSRKHLSEFRMLEIELAYSKTISDIMDLMEDSTKVFLKHVEQLCASDLNKLMKKRPEHTQIVERAISTPFVRMNYTEAVDLLQNKSTLLKTAPPMWGDDLNADHETFLTSYSGSTPVFVTDFPSETRPFYMLSNSDERTVAAVDLLFPHCGELCGGSVREYRLDVLQKKLESLKMADKYDWYLDLRRFGGTPHAGYGMGFERLVMFLLGLRNIRDAVPFPRGPPSCVL